MRTWKVTDHNGTRKYRGFNKNFNTRHDVVVVLVDGEAEVWAVDGVRGFEYLIDYLSQPDNQHGKVQILGRYEAKYFLGVTCDPLLAHPLPDLKCQCCKEPVADYCLNDGHWVCSKCMKDQGP